MTFNEAVEQQPLWVQYWLYVLIFGILVFPLALLIWKQTRLTAVITVATSIIAGFGVSMLYDKLGYVKLLSLPHIILWTPLAYYLFRQINRNDMPMWPRRIMMAVLAIFVVSLLFDYVDVVRYVLGERAATVKPT
jgi:hypothetical protein